MPPKAMSRPDLQLRNQAAQRRHRAERDDAAGARGLRRHVLDRHGKARGVGVDFDAVGVAIERRIGPDFEPRFFRADAGEAKGGRNIDVLREAAGALARRAVEHFARRVQTFERNAALDQIRRAVEAVRRLARDHGHRMDRAFGGGAYRVEPDQAAGRHQDARAGLFGPRHQIPVVQKLADAERHEQLAALDHRRGHRAEHRRRQAFDHQVAGFHQRFRGDDRNAAADLRQIAPRLVLIADRDRRQNQARNTGLDPPRHVEADRAEPAQPDLKRLSHVVFPHPGRSPLSPVHSVSMRRPGAAQQSGTPCLMADKRHFMTNVNPNTFTTRPEIEGTFGVVTTTHWIATAVGMGILERGGNAFDAGVATAFTLQVVEPHLNGPGGDVPVIVHDVKRGKSEVICGQGPAPAGATIAHYRSEGLEMVPGTGLLAACVPGTFESWMLLLRHYGTLRLRDVLEPAIAYARDGYPLVERASATIKTVEQMFRTYWTTSAAVYLPNNEVPKPGTLFTNKTLSETYARILKEAESAGSDRVAQIERARAAWSRGFVAEAIDNFCRTQEVMDVSGSPHRGVLRADDMARWQPSVEAPLTYDYGRYTVCKPGVWSQGPVMLQQLALLKGFELDGLDPAGPEFIHLQIECAKLAFADREKFYGDPKFSEIPISTLLSDAYNDERRKLISEKASLDFIPGSVEGFGSVVKLRHQEGNREAVGAMGAGEPTVGRFGEVRGDTVHFDIIDQAGNMISG